MEEEYTSDGIYDSPAQAPKKPKFQICSDPAQAQDINPQIIYSIIDDEENTTMIQGRIFEVKKNIMSKASYNNGPEQDFNGQISNDLKESCQYSFDVQDRYYTKMKVIMDQHNLEMMTYIKNRGQLCLHCLSYHVGDCDKKTCFKCGRLGHLVSQCPFKYDKLTCFKCGKKGHKIYDCQIVIISSNPMNSFSVDKEPISVESQKRGWMKEELKKGKCVQCTTVGHLYCTSEHLMQSKADNIYKGENLFGAVPAIGMQGQPQQQLQSSPNINQNLNQNLNGNAGQVQPVMNGYNGLGGLLGAGGYDYYGNFITQSHSQNQGQNQIQIQSQSQNQVHNQDQIMDSNLSLNSRLTSNGSYNNLQHNLNNFKYGPSPNGQNIPYNNNISQDMEYTPNFNKPIQNQQFVQSQPQTNIKYAQNQNFDASRPIVSRIRVEPQSMPTSSSRPMTQFESSFAKFNQLGSAEQMKKRAINAFFEAEEKAESKRKINQSESQERALEDHEYLQESLNKILDMPEI